MDKPCRKCLCQLCNRWGPKWKQLLEAVPEELQDTVNELYSEFDSVKADLNYAEAQLDGSWPGWEWLPAARDQAEKDAVKDG